jgi:hypothetical protein
MNIKKLIENFRDDLGLDDEDAPTNQVIRWINRAGEWMTDLDAYAIERRYSIAQVANQFSYSLPADFFDRKLLLIDNDDRTKDTDVNEILASKIGFPGKGEVYMSGIWEGKLWIQGTPGSGAVTTTLSGGISSSATSLTVVTPSGGVQGRGCVKIDNEKIYYENAEASGSNTILSVLTRGVEDTAAAAHLDGATVTWHGIELFYYARYRDMLNAPETGRTDIGTSGTLLDAGRHYLMTTFYDNVRGLESYPHDLYSITTAATEKISLTNLVDAADLKTYQKRIYMTKADYSQPFYLVTALDAGTNSYDIDIADATLELNAAFNWDNVGGDNLPDEFRGAVEEKVKALYLRRSKRYGEAGEYESLAVQKFLAAKKVVQSRRSAVAMSRKPDIWMGR